MKMSETDKLLLAIQNANMVVGDLLSAYWTKKDGKPTPNAFLVQAREHLKVVVDHLKDETAPKV